MQLEITNNFEDMSAPLMYTATVRDSMGDVMAVETARSPVEAIARAQSFINA